MSDMMTGKAIPSWCYGGEHPWVRGGPLGWQCPDCGAQTNATATPMPTDGKAPPPANTRGEREKVIEECARMADARAAWMRTAANSASKVDSGPEYTAAEVYRNQADYALLIGSDIRALAEDGPPTKE